MEAKKNPKYSLDQYRPLFFNIGLVVSMGLVLSVFEYKHTGGGDLVELTDDNAKIEELLDIPVTQQPPPPPPKQQIIQVVEVPNVEEIEDELEIELDIEITEETVIAPIETNDMEFEEVEEETTEEIFMIVEEQPMPVGGFQEFYKFVGENLKYPAFAQANNVEGRVFVQFVVEKDGTLTQFEIVRGIGYGADEEAIRVLKMAPKWKPGKQRGHPVRVRMFIPINFKLANL